MAALWYGLILLNLLVLDKHTQFRLFNVPEVHIFSMMGVIEICIRRRLIPSNDNYTGFFRRVRMPVMITDRHFRPQYGSETELRAEIRKREGTPGMTVTLETNGNPPTAPIRESGGLRSLRALAEQHGGSMQIVSSPAFRLILTLPGE